MELHSKITYYITNLSFKELIYVEHWHGKVESKFSSYEEFESEFKKCFNLDYMWEHYPIWMGEQSDLEAYEEERDEIIELIKSFYPILRTVASGCSEDPTEEILDTIIESYFSELSK